MGRRGAGVEAATMFAVSLSITLVMTLVLGALLVADLTNRGRPLPVSAVVGAGADQSSAGLSAGGGGGTAAQPGAAGSGTSAAAGGAAAAAAAGPNGEFGQSPPVPAPVDGQGVTDSSITVGTVILESGVADLTPQLHGIEAYLQKVNHSGGVNGRQVRIVSADDGSSPSRGEEELNQMEQQDHIFALLGECAPLTDVDTDAFIRQNALPSVGVCTWPSAAYNDPYVYPGSISEVHTGNFYGQWVLSHLNHQTVGMISEDESVIQDFAGGVRSWLSDHGSPINSSLDLKSPTGAPDYSTYVQTMQSNHVTALVVMLTPADTIAFCKSANQAAYHPDWTGLDGTEASVLASGQCEGMYAHQPIDPTTANSAAMSEFRKDMATYEPDEANLSGAVEGYESAKLFVHVLGELGHNVTRTRLMQALNGLRAYDGGFMPRYSFTFGTPHERVLATKWFVNRHGSAVQLDDQWHYLN